jgi:hypothetical protein
MSNFLRKVNRKNDKLVLKKYDVQNFKISNLLGASDDEIDYFFDYEFDESLYGNKKHNKIKKSSDKSTRLSKLKQKQSTEDFLLENDNARIASLIASGDLFYDNKKYIITFEWLKNGSKRYFFNIVDTKPYLRNKIRIKHLFKPGINKNKIVFDTLKRKNLYYLKKPFEELLKYIHLQSLKIIMTIIYSEERLYIRSCLEFYLQKYQIHFKRYVDNSSDRVKKYRALHKKDF